MAYDLSQLSILVADDDSFILSLTRSLLNGFGITKVRTVTDSNIVLDELQTSTVDVLMVDWDMEPMNGIELTRFIRMHPDSPNRYLPVIIMTGHTEMSIVLKARDAGVTEFLAKPMTVRSMYQRIVSVIERPRPFVRSSDYFGPDRRRIDDPNYSGPERRGDPEDSIEI
ncbi:MAG: response regulator [Alphaproteobacteria bacterium]|nr:response regulator [Alphaproteobacteria bacterium]